MSDPSGTSSVPNGNTSSLKIDPLQRLSSFKTPRDLSLGAVKPNKKIFTPNLNVSRSKNKGPALPTVTKDKKDKNKGKNDRKNDRNKNFKNGPSIIKSSGVFSEGMGVSERQSSRVSYGRDVDAAPTLQKPFIKVKDFYKIDKKLEDQKIKKVLGDTNLHSDEEVAEPTCFDTNAPVKLPLSDGGWLHSKPKPKIKVEQQIIIKEEPRDLDGHIPPPIEVKPVVDVKKETGEDVDIVSLLRSDKPALLMLQFPDSLPGNAGRLDDDGPKKKQPNGESGTAPNSSESEEKEEEARCRLMDLQEGKVGKLIVHRSGKVKLAFGESIFEVSAGTQSSFYQEAVSVAADDESRSANLVSLGALPHKLNLLPHWETMMADIAL